jgi:hypothetical protein
MTFFDLVLQTGSSLHPHVEPDGLISEYHGVIRCERKDGGKWFKVGKAHAYRVHAGQAANQGESLFDVCDAHSQEMHVLHTLLYEERQYGFKGAITEQFEAMEPDLLVIDYVVLHPRWRGLKLGLLAVRKMVDLLGGGCGLTACHIAPLKPDAHGMLKVPPSWLPRHDTPDARKDAVRKLRRYYRRMGFERIGRTPYYGLSMARVVPDLEDLLKPTQGGGPQRRPGS